MRVHEQTPLLPRAPQAVRDPSIGPFLTSGMRRAEALSLHDQAGLLAFGGAAAIYTRQFFAAWVLSAERAITGVALRGSVAVATATLGRYTARQLIKETRTPPPSPAAEGSEGVPQRRAFHWKRAVPSGLALARLLACPLGEAPAMGVSGVLHAALELGPDVSPKVLAVMEWLIYGAYIAVREVAFAEMGTLHRHVVHLEGTQPSVDEACNGHPAICPKRWCDVVFPATHNAVAVPAPFTKLPWPLNQIGRFASNQERTLEQQFADGIRGHLLEYYLAPNGQLMSSHNTVWQIEPLVHTFERLRNTVAAHPRDLLVLKMSPQGVDEHFPWLLAPLVQEALQRSGLAQYMRTPSYPQWQPALYGGGLPCDLRVGPLLDENVRVIAFEGGFRESFYSASHVSEITCHDLLPWDGGPNAVPVTLNAFTSYAFQPASDAVNAHLTGVYNACATLLGASFRPTLLAVNSYESSVVVPLAHALNTQGTLPDSQAVAHRHAAMGLVSDGIILAAALGVLGVAVLLSVLKRRIKPANPSTH